MARVGPFLPDSYLFGIGLFAVGALGVDFFEKNAFAEQVAIIGWIAMGSALAGAIFFSLLFKNKYSNVDFIAIYQNSNSGQMEKISIYSALIVSAVVSIFFIYLIFSNSVISALLSIASFASGSSLITARKAITSGTEGYFAPGYIKQFRDILIPIFLVSLMLIRKKYTRSMIFWIALSSAFLAMVVAGQRLIIVVLMLSLLVGGVYASKVQLNNIKRGNFPKLRLIMFLVIIFSLYGAMTIFLGRIDKDASLFDVLGEFVWNIVDRAILAAPRENIITFPLWSTIGPTYGQSWLAEIAGILPGVSESFSNILHSRTGGSLQGNSPLALPSDVWLAWGWIGVITVPFIYAVLIGTIDMALLSERAVTFFGVKIFLFINLPIIYSPFGFILYGGAVALILIMLIKLLRIGRSSYGGSTAVH